MAAKRKTVHVGDLVQVSNRMISHLAESGTKSDADKREAIIAVTSSILLDSNAYRGFRYLNAPLVVKLTGEKIYDDSRIEFLG